MPAARELPKYQCHKIVHALKIKEIHFGGVVSTVCSITPEEEGYAPFEVPPDYVEKHKPQSGGYYVVYEDGYASFSPAKAFENGYTRIK